eukprot:CAMPEP_0179408534 /NCGR_PEP_ID=MMETSP0799-20121207/2149_1 /TAXON_ID=46947 /ORGANISM="Geminigera cryophila, Strain CCMP2564" /LENGTH=100 /DNA_ID=CAMNT_0021180011 /DNA_START=91 /DNA_END=394 /DNA_ORIENTATION=-
MKQRPSESCPWAKPLEHQQQPSPQSQHDSHEDSSRSQLHPQATHQQAISNTPKAVGNTDSTHESVSPKYLTRRSRPEPLGSFHPETPKSPGHGTGGAQRA